MTGVESILAAVAGATAEIRSGLAGRRGTIDAENPSGDAPVVADRWVDDLLFERFDGLDAVGSFASEERAEVHDVGGGYGVAIDPLDGSSNLKSNNTVGTIVGVYDAPLPAAGRDLVASAYVLYGPYTTMTVAHEGSVERRVIRDGETVDSEPVAIGDGPEVRGVAGRASEWEPGLRSYVDDLRSECKPRYTGAMVADAEQLLTFGGLLAYPSTPDRPDGILRLQFESNPVAHVVETAGGRSSDGAASILDREPTGLHESVPTYFGSPSLIDDLEATLGRRT